MTKHFSHSDFIEFKEAIQADFEAEASRLEAARAAGQALHLLDLITIAAAKAARPKCETPDSPPTTNRGGTNRGGTNRGGTLRKTRKRLAAGAEILVKERKIFKPAASAVPAVAENPAENGADPAQSAPPSASRAMVTSDEMEAFLKLWFYDWLTVTIPAGTTGKGTRRGVGQAAEISAGQIEDAEGRHAAQEFLRVEAEAGEEEEAAARKKLCNWALAADLHMTLIGAGKDGYKAGGKYGPDPTSNEVLATIRAGHPINMPGVSMSGGDGACARLAPLALSLLGPVLLARADVTFDHSRAGYFDELLEYTQEISKKNKMKSPSLIESGTGRTFKFGGDGARVTVYQKDLERVADGKLAEEDADPDLIRVEFRIAPDSSRKAGMAALAREGGPGALLRAVHWVREMVKYIAELTGAAEAGAATLAVARVQPVPDPKTVQDRAAHGLGQYSMTFCMAAAAEIVAEKFGGDWRAAVINPDEVIDRAMQMIRAGLEASEAPFRSVARLGLDRARTINEQAERDTRRLEKYIERQTRDEERAQAALLESARKAAEARAPA